MKLLLFVLETLILYGYGARYVLYYEESLDVYSNDFISCLSELKFHVLLYSRSNRSFKITNTEKFTYISPVEIRNFNDKDSIISALGKQNITLAGFVWSLNCSISEIQDQYFPILQKYSFWTLFLVSSESFRIQNLNVTKLSDKVVAFLLPQIYGSQTRIQTIFVSNLLVKSLINDVLYVQGLETSLNIYHIVDILHIIQNITTSFTNQINLSYIQNMNLDTRYGSSLSLKEALKLIYKVTHSKSPLIITPSKNSHNSKDMFIIDDNENRNKPISSFTSFLIGIVSYLEYISTSDLDYLMTLEFKRCQRIKSPDLNHLDGCHISLAGHRYFESFLNTSTYHGEFLNCFRGLRANKTTKHFIYLEKQGYLNKNHNQLYVIRKDVTKEMTSPENIENDPLFRMSCQEEFAGAAMTSSSSTSTREYLYFNETSHRISPSRDVYSWFRFVYNHNNNLYAIYVTTTNQSIHSQHSSTTHHTTPIQLLRVRSAASNNIKDTLYYDIKSSGSTELQELFGIFPIHCSPSLVHKSMGVPSSYSVVGGGSTCSVWDVTARLPHIQLEPISQMLFDLPSQDFNDPHRCSSACESYSNDGHNDSSTAGWELDASPSRRTKSRTCEKLRSSIVFLRREVKRYRQLLQHCGNAHKQLIARLHKYYYGSNSLDNDDMYGMMNTTNSPPETDPLQKTSDRMVLLSTSLPFHHNDTTASPSSPPSLDDRGLFQKANWRQALPPCTTDCNLIGGCMRNGRCRCEVPLCSDMTFEEISTQSLYPLPYPNDMLNHTLEEVIPGDFGDPKLQTQKVPVMIINPMTSHHELTMKSAASTSTIKSCYSERPIPRTVGSRKALQDLVDALPRDGIFQPHILPFLGDRWKPPRIHVLPNEFSSKEMARLADMEKTHYCFNNDRAIFQTLEHISTPLQEAELVFPHFYHGLINHFLGQQHLRPKLESVLNSARAAVRRSSLPSSPTSSSTPTYTGSSPNPHQKQLVLILSHDYGGCLYFKWNYQQFGQENRQRFGLNDTLLLSSMGDYNTNCYMSHKDTVIPANSCHYRKLIARYSDFSQIIPIEERFYFVFFRGKSWGPGMLTRERISQYDLYPHINRSHLFLSTGQANTDVLKLIGNSVFCLCVPGMAGWSSRLTDIIYSGCIPVLISGYTHYPFHHILDYRRFSVVVETEHLEDIEGILQGVSIKKRVEKQLWLLKVRDSFIYNNFDILNSVVDLENQKGPVFLSLLSLKLKMLTQYF